jgi:hypothetical protein
MSQADIANIVYLLGALLIFGMAAAGASRRAKSVGAKGPGVVSSLLIWLALIGLVAALYFGAQLWRGVFATLS